MCIRDRIIDVPQTFLIGAAQSADGSKKQQFWSGTLYQCRVYKGPVSYTHLLPHSVARRSQASIAASLPAASVRSTASSACITAAEKQALLAVLDVYKRQRCWH